MGEEFDFWTKLEDSYSIEDILCIINVTTEELLKNYLREEILAHKEDFFEGDEYYSEVYDG